jgi:hypothetical protein
VDPKFETECKEQCMQWRISTAPLPPVPKKKQIQFTRPPSTEKIMVTLFWDEVVIILVSVLPTDTIMNYGQSTEILKKEVWAFTFFKFLPNEKCQKPCSFMIASRHTQT